MAKKSILGKIWTSLFNVTKSDVSNPPEDIAPASEDSTAEADTVFEPEGEAAEADTIFEPEGEDAEPDTVFDTSAETTDSTVFDTLSEDTAEVSSDLSDIRIGDTILNTYRVESDMIAGGMGAVWKVYHEGWDTELAMKRPKPEVFRSNGQKESFIRECDCWINLGLHPNIVSCYYVREINGVPTIFSEWMENGDLERHIKDGTLYAGTDEVVRERLLDITIQFARGLHYAHENNLIHQDVKPDNLLLTEDWQAKVSDFGISRARSILTVPEGEWTQREFDSNATQMAPGGGMTPAYCSPEQAARQLLTQRTDIYSWAVSVLEMYLGYKPWAHGREASGPMAGIACRDYFDMCTERPIPKKLQELLEKCLAQSPDDRPHDFGEVKAELLSIYRTVTGSDYPRLEPQTAADTADSLNNRALSFLDLGRTEDAESLWEDALTKSAGHVNTIFNRALSRWRRGEIDRAEAEKELNNSTADEKQREELAGLLQQEEHGTIILAEPTNRPGSNNVPDPMHVPDFDKAMPFDRSGDGMRISVKLNQEGYRTWFVWDLKEERTLLLRDKNYITNVPTWEMVHDEPLVITEKITLSRDGRYALVTVLYLLPPEGRKNYTRRKIQVVELDSGEVVREFELVGITLNWTGDCDAETLNAAPKCFAVLSPDNTVLAISRRTIREAVQGRPFQTHCETEFWSMDTGKCISRAQNYSFLGFTEDGSTILYNDAKGRIYFGGRPENPLPSRAPSLKAEKDYYNYGTSVYQLSGDLGLIELKTHMLLCDLRRGTLLRTVRKGGNETTRYFVRTQDGRWLLSLSSRISGFWQTQFGVSVEVWDAETWQYMGSDYQLISRTQKSNADQPDEDEAKKQKARTLCLFTELCPIQYFAGMRAEYRLNRIEETGARLDAQKEFNELIGMAKAAKAPKERLLLIDKALSIPGFEASPEALRLRAELSSKLSRRTPLRIAPTTEKTRMKSETDNRAVDVGSSRVSSAVIETTRTLLADLQHRWEETLERFEEWSVKPRWGSFSRDGRRILVHTDSRYYFNSPEFSWIDDHHCHGAAVIDVRSGKILWQADKLFRQIISDSGSGPKSVVDEYETIMDPCGEFLLTRGGKKLLLTDITKNIQKTLLQEPLRYACFLKDRRFVLCQCLKSADVIVINTVTEERIEFPFSAVEYGNVRYINDDCFAIKHGKDEELCWIVWEYDI